MLPIFRAHCITCHSEDRASGGLDLSTYAATVEGGNSDDLIISGAGRESNLLKRIRGEGGKPQMPMGFAPISAEKIATIEEWINQGAQPGSGEEFVHWSYAIPERPSIPKVSDPDWVQTPIDAFILARLDAEGLKPSPRASDEKLVRRASLDVTGLPPSLAQIEGYASMEDLSAELLASPHYGERQAVVWLDLARYADTNGYEKDRSRVMWPYRDWVIDAYNQNMPFDEFTVEQLAGDMLPQPTQDQLIATGFHRNTMHNEEGGVDPEEQRWLTIVDRVATTGQVWLGTTLGCAQCHDHKYDPISNDEYFAFFAYFDNSEEPALSLTDPEDQPKLAELRSKAASLTEALKDQELAEDHRKKLQEDLNKTNGEINSLIYTALIFKEKAGQPKTMARDGGTFLAPTHEVYAGVPEVLPPMEESLPNNRLGLAQWLVSETNPLTARVIVNRIWEQYFGFGIVKTSEDFGSQSSGPSHPELLDWLAVEFMESGWDQKHIHQLILNSAVYQQSSRVTSELLAKDPENRLLARGPRFRLDAEFIRDNALRIGGLLSDEIGGPSVYPPQPDGIWDSPYSGERWIESSGENRYRRGLYTFWKRTATYPAFLTFDATSRESCTIRRIRTNTPLQALVIMNDPVYMEAAQGLAQRMLKLEGSVEERVAYGFQLCTARKPSEKEAKTLTDYIARQQIEFAGKPAEAQKLAPRVDQAAWVMAASVLLNLDETITKD